MKIVSIIGARPQFIKAAVISKVIAEYDSISEVLVHTGQHYDANMSRVFFEELEIPFPKYNLGAGSASHAVQTAEMLTGVEKVLEEEKPDWTIVYGDTNSTIAGSLTAAKLNLKIAHVEAGLRSYNRLMPEEINRIATDHISDLLFAPSLNAMKLLKKEGLEEASVFSGDVMYDSILYYKDLAETKYSLEDMISFNNYYLATIHRQENTDYPDKLQNIFSALSELELPVILPLHPRTKKHLANIKFSKNIKVIEPVSYLKLILLLKNCSKVLTDSGGLQKEAYFLKKPCVTLREETEWIETLNNGWNFVAGTDKDLILKNISNNDFGEQEQYFGNGKAGEIIVAEIERRS
jgi:UDP-GlcNAc3NAcA epimerase